MILLRVPQREASAVAAAKKAKIARTQRVRRLRRKEIMVVSGKILLSFGSPRNTTREELEDRWNLEIHQKQKPIVTEIFANQRKLLSISDLRIYFFAEPFVKTSKWFASVLLSFFYPALYRSFFTSLPRQYL